MGPGEDTVLRHLFSDVEPALALLASTLPGGSCVSREGPRPGRARGTATAMRSHGRVHPVADATMAASGAALPLEWCATGCGAAGLDAAGLDMGSNPAGCGLS